jgi:hypothetical protein
MKKRFITTFLVQSITLAAVMLFTIAAVMAQGPINAIRNIVNPVEADPKKEYLLTDAEGPYLIFVTSFQGPSAKQEAHDLVLELRKECKWNAYVWEKSFVHDVKKDFINEQPRGVVYQKTGGTQFAVVIGNFQSLEDKAFKTTLENVKKYQPMKFRGMENRGKGKPNASYTFAFGVANPMLPPERQMNNVVDAFIASINKDRPYSLMKNPRRYTVQIASFSGNTVTQKQSDILKLISDGSKNPPKQEMSQLEQGERSTVALCQALRERGFDAYEFHDYYVSIVTVGSFDQHVRQMPDGTKVIDPQVLQVIQHFQARADAAGTIKPIVINGIKCDMQPQVIEVPRVKR